MRHVQTTNSNKNALKVELRSTLKATVFGASSLALVAGLAIPMAAAAQAAPQTDQGAQLEEVVVTAQRREENLQNVPVSVTALSNAQIERAQITTIQGLQAIAPSLTNFYSRGDKTSLSLSLRGVPSNNLGVIADSTVGVYMNGVYLARQSGQGLGLMDMERVEILSGPQGTLFGRNTIGGALNLTTKRPTNAFEGEITAGIGNYDTRQVRAILNLPLVEDKVAVRLLWDHDEHSGYNFNPVLNKDWDWRNTDYLRGTLKINIDDWESVTTIDYVDSNASNAGLRLRAADLSAPPNLQIPVTRLSGGTDNVLNYIGGKFHRVYTTLDEEQPLEVWGVSHVLRHKFGDVNFTSISGFRELRVSTPADQIGLPYFLSRQPNFGERQQQWSQEIQLDGSLLDGKLDFVTGAIWFEENGRDFTRPTDAVSYVTGLPSTTTNDADFAAKNRSIGAFVQATYHATDKLNLTGGVRYTQDKRTVEWHNRSLFFPSLAFRACTFPPAALGYPTDPVNCTTGPVSKKFDYVPWTIIVDYQATDDVMVYGKISEGFRSGGYPPGIAALPGFFNAFDPEKLRTYEAGVKSTLFDRRVRLNLAVYKSDYHDIQLQSLQGGLPTISNFGDGRIWGGEGDLTIRLGDVQLRSTAAYTDAKFVSGPYFDGVPGQNIARTPYLFTPKWTFNQSVDYTVPVSGVGNVNLHADYAYRSKIFFAVLNPGTPALWPFMSVPGYGLFNASVELELENTPVTFKVWGRNLADKEYFTTTSDASGRSRSTSGFIGDPRTYGATVSYKF